MFIVVVILHAQSSLCLHMNPFMRYSLQDVRRARTTPNFQSSRVRGVLVATQICYVQEMVGER